LKKIGWQKNKIRLVLNQYQICAGESVPANKAVKIAKMLSQRFGTGIKHQQITGKTCTGIYKTLFPPE